MHELKQTPTPSMLYVLEYAAHRDRSATISNLHGVCMCSRGLYRFPVGTQFMIC